MKKSALDALVSRMHSEIKEQTGVNFHVEVFDMEAGGEFYPPSDREYFLSHEVSIITGKLFVSGFDEVKVFAATMPGATTPTVAIEFCKSENDGMLEDDPESEEK